MMKPEHIFCLLVSCCFFQNINCKQIKPDCSAVSCLACPENHKAVTVEHECCPHCIPQCLCPPFLVDDCLQEGYEDKILLLGQSVHIDFATRLCTCESVQNIQCHSICPEIPSTCKHISTPLDGCPMCACTTENDGVVAAGETITEKCKICKCPPEGGKLQCTFTC